MPSQRLSDATRIRLAFEDDRVEVRWCGVHRTDRFRFRTARQRRALRAHDMVRVPAPEGGTRGRPFVPRPDADCITYVLDTGILTIGAKSPTALLRVADLLLRPSRLPKDPVISVVSSSGRHPVTAWPETASHTYRPSPSVFRLPGLLALAEETPSIQRIGSMEVRTVMVGRTRPNRAVVEMVRDASRALHAIAGPVPREVVLVVVEPVTWGRAVGFGQVLRGGGPAVRLRVSPEARAEDLVGTWTATHEFVHVAMPLVREPWLGEGIASYYTEVARTRIGHRSEAEGWQALEAAFSRGRRRGGGRSLAATSRHMHAWSAYQRVYWGGAAICFLLDVEIRRRTGGRQGLDDAVRSLSDLFGRPRAIPARRILERWEHLYGPGLRDLAERHLASPGFPDLSDAYAYLGVLFDGGAVRLDDAAPGAVIRRAIMAPRRFEAKGASEARRLEIRGQDAAR